MKKKCQKSAKKCQCGGDPWYSLNLWSGMFGMLVGIIQGVARWRGPWGLSAKGSNVKKVPKKCQCGGDPWYSLILWLGMFGMLVGIIQGVARWWGPWGVSAKRSNVKKSAKKVPRKCQCGGDPWYSLILWSGMFGMLVGIIQGVARWQGP